MLITILCFTISENLEEREKQFSEFVKSKCYSPEEISDVLRNKLTIVFKESMCRLFSC